MGDTLVNKTLEREIILFSHIKFKLLDKVTKL